ncbi:RusA family crossover junction endodeoxyribonuclease [Alicyclobacillus fastidiosus]|uniref:RusA family crossover junction endodeoxyribonuclease n=1 Tax=Alicyclobacillus fastidiosus TaxID=392011 RepID=A0ABY6ZL62_9BACL|nr:RusA family crossover junction endodeoxyribonuclease [Alicyclobacillus fastidiosus]WAH43540.1 RusA family crossover junction endodeoxyribonuclease [Alicyclobacillus fastidiosus]GMA59713.1 hypothetical protein GCM10025859_01530 [Alicyclobacillus fastidiosus]GMA65562.1 hypothetical protein GCM10025859_60020 [Alicyclobacillus fastidiosus]
MANSTRLVLPLPPSVNHAYRNFTKCGRRMRVPTPKALAFKKEAAWEAKAWMMARRQQMVPNGTKVALKVWYFWGDRRRHDQDNPLKLLQDALTGVVWEDDRWVLPQVMDFDVDKQNPRLEIEIEVLG